MAGNKEEKSQELMLKKKKGIYKFPLKQVVVVM